MPLEKGKTRWEEVLISLSLWRGHPFPLLQGFHIEKNKNRYI
jgi:hypothetical protein